MKSIAVIAFSISATALVSASIASAQVLSDKGRPNSGGSTSGSGVMHPAKPICLSPRNDFGYTYHNFRSSGGGAVQATVTFNKGSNSQSWAKLIVNGGQCDYRSINGSGSVRLSCNQGGNITVHQYSGSNTSISGIQVCGSGLAYTSSGN